MSILVLVLLTFPKILYASSLQCTLTENPETRFFATLKDYESNKVPFNPARQEYQGSQVEFTFETINKLQTNAFISFDSSNITRLILSKKSIFLIDEGAFNSLFCCHFLDLSFNKLSNLSHDMLKGLPNLVTLNLSGNWLRELKEMTFILTPRLETLNLSLNKLSLLHPFVFYHLNNLKSLNLANNRFKDLISEIFLPLFTLETLDLSSNQMYQADSNKWRGLIQLKSLDLSNNSITQFDCDYNFSFILLTQLNLKGNFLTKLNTFSLQKNLPSLKTLNLENNLFGCLEALEIKHEMIDSRINIVFGWQLNEQLKKKCSGSNNEIPSYSPKPDYPEEVTTTTTERTKLQIKELQEVNNNERMLMSNNDILMKVNYVQSVVTFLVIFFVMYVILTVIIKIGVCEIIYRRFTRRSEYIDGSYEHFGLLNR